MATKKNTLIRQNNKEYGYFRITKTVGHKTVDGKKKPVRKQFYGSSKQAAERAYQEWRDNQLLKTQEHEILLRTRTFEEATDFYCQNILSVNSAYSIGTRELYINAYNAHVKNSKLKSMILSDVKAEDLQMFYNNLNVTKSALDTVHKFMRGFFKWACSMNYCENIISSVILPEKTVVKKQEDIVVWEDDEIDRIFTSEKDYIYLPLLKFAYYTGMRISELLGLKWIDISEDLISIRRQFYRGTWTPPKNNKERKVPIHENLREVMDGMLRESELVFPSSVGTPLDYHNVIKSINAFYKRNDIPKKKFHAYRATFCTNLCKRGVPIQIASRLAGHSSIGVTAKYYTSITVDEEQEAISKL